MQVGFTRELQGLQLETGNTECVAAAYNWCLGMLAGLGIGWGERGSSPKLLLESKKSNGQ